MIGLLLAIIGALWAGVCLAFAPRLYRYWREPVLRYPVLIIESDDWGAGPLEQAAALEKLRTLLLSFKDKRERHPVMTVGVILAIADTVRIRMERCKAYFSLDLTRPEFSAIREQLLKGRQEGVFALQLHGKEHYWPDSLLRAAQADEEVRSWISDEGIPSTERLPSQLQARWTDASTLPSRAHPQKVIDTAVSDEVNLFETCFGERPQVAVATTFVWNANVERAWADHGVKTIITPGRRYTLRDAQGHPGGFDKIISNGDHSDAEQIYLVRDCYFEPGLGHDPSRLIGDAVRHSLLGRPALVEMHRFNFLGSAERINSSLMAMQEGIAGVLRALPDIRFMSSRELVEILRTSDADIVERRWISRARAWLRRIDELQSFRKYAKATGLITILWLLKKGLSSLSLRKRDRG